MPQTTASSTPKRSRKASCQAWVMTSRSGVSPVAGPADSTSSSRLRWAGKRIATVAPLSATWPQNSPGLKRSTTVRRHPACSAIDWSVRAPTAWASGVGRKTLSSGPTP